MKLQTCVQSTAVLNAVQAMHTRRSYVGAEAGIRIELNLEAKEIQVAKQRKLSSCGEASIKHQFTYITPTKLTYVYHHSLKLTRTHIYVMVSILSYSLLS